MIVGGESGAGARPMEVTWVTSIRDRCAAAGVPFFFQQWGGVRKGKAGRLLDGRTYDEMPERVQRAVLPAAGRAAAIAEIEAIHLPHAAVTPPDLFTGCEPVPAS